MAKFEKVNAVETQEVTFWKPTRAGEYVEGIYTKRVEGILTQFGTIDAIQVTDANGEVWQILLTAGLVRAVNRLSIGELIRIEYAGRAYNKATKRQFNEYIVYRDTSGGDDLPF